MFTKTVLKDYVSSRILEVYLKKVCKSYNINKDTLDGTQSQGYGNNSIANYSIFMAQIESLSQTDS